MTPPKRPIDTSPVIPQQVLEYLERLFPPEQPKLHDLDRAIWIRVGHQQVLSKLRDLFTKQQE
jgi:hypothetical protein